MKKKCVQVEPMEAMKMSMVQQPEWVQAEKILDAITSYASFEDQAGKLRLVCRQFDASSLRQLEAKLDKIKVIGFRRDGPTSYFKATVQRGWSDTCLTSKESVVDDAIWLASCRCRFQYCADKGSCKNVSNPLTCSVYKSEEDETRTIDVTMVRRKLRDQGQVDLTEEFRTNEVKCSFEEGKTNLFTLCRKVDNAVNVSLSHHLKRDYGVSESIGSRQFLRSIFLIFARAESKITNTKKKKRKAPRKAPSQKVTIGMAESRIRAAEEGRFFFRMKKIIRFYSAANEPLEICIESRYEDCW